MARSNGSVAFAGVLICFASLVVSINGGGGLVDSGELVEETVLAWNPQLATTTPISAPTAALTAPISVPPSALTAPISAPPAAPTAPISAPTAAPPLSTGTGTCPVNNTNNFWNMFDIHTNVEHVIVSANGDAAQMRLDSISAAAFGSKNDYFTGRFSAFLKLPCGNSSGTVFAYYTSSNGSAPDHDEIDIEILGNETDTTYTMQTNIFVNGVGNREMRHELGWFNPCQDYHEYFIQWNSQITMIGVDNSVLRVFYKNAAWPYFNKGQGLWVSYWDGSKWATQGGRLKIDFQRNGPFIANINGLNNLQGCEVPWERDVSPCLGVPHCWDTQETLTPSQQQDLAEKNANYCTYNYCEDYTRFASTGFPADCQK